MLHSQARRSNVDRRKYCQLSPKGAPFREVLGPRGSLQVYAAMFCLSEPFSDRFAVSFY